MTELLTNDDFESVVRSLAATLEFKYDANSIYVGFEDVKYVLTLKKLGDFNEN